MSRVAGTVFAAAALSAVVMPGAHALTADTASEVHPASSVSTASTAPRHAAPVAPRQAAPVAARGEGWSDDCDHFGGHCHRRLHDVRCRYRYHRRECAGWDGDRPWRSYDEWWHEGPDHAGFGWSDGPDERRRGLGDGRGGNGWRWREDGGDRRSFDRGDDNRRADRGATDAPSMGNADGNRSAGRGGADTPAVGNGDGDGLPGDRGDAPTNPGAGGDGPSDRSGDGQGRTSDPSAATPAMGPGSTPTGG